MCNNYIQTVGSICSGVEAASIAWNSLDWQFKWFSEISEFPSKVLAYKYPNVENLGDMTIIPELIRTGQVDTPDLICGGTPCQAFSLAGLKTGLNDDRGNLTLTFVDIINANDEARKHKGLDRSVVFWENVEGVLSDKTNAFGCFISSLAGLDEALEQRKWPKSGLLKGPQRNVAWRILDAKFFGLPQQRRRLYVLAGGKSFNPDAVLFEKHIKGSSLIDEASFPKSNLRFVKDGVNYEVFREYTDCLYSAYGTKWNGNAAAYNGSLFIVQDHNIRRLTPLECERLMGLPDNHTLLDKTYRTNRYQAIGNSWATPVVKWIGERIVKGYESISITEYMSSNLGLSEDLINESEFYDLEGGIISLNEGISLNCTAVPEDYVFGKMYDVVTSDAPKNLYLSPTACAGILRRKNERGININPRLEKVLTKTASKLPPEEIEKRSRIQKRGRFSNNQASLF